MFFARPQGKSKIFNCRKSEGVDHFVQLYGRSALIAPINGTITQRSRDQQYWENIQHVL